MDTKSIIVTATSLKELGEKLLNHPAYIRDLKKRSRILAQIQRTKHDQGFVERDLHELLSMYKDRLRLTVNANFKVGYNDNVPYIYSMGNPLISSISTGERYLVVYTDKPLTSLDQIKYNEL